MQFRVLATLGRKRSRFGETVESVGQDLERRTAASSRLVRGGRLGEVVRHGECCTESSRLPPRQGKVAGTDGAQPLPSIRLLVTARCDGCEGVLHAVRRQSLRGRRHGVEECLPVGEVPVGGVGRDRTAAGGFAKHDSVWPALPGHLHPRLEEGIPQVTVMVLVACCCHLDAPSGRPSAIVPLWTVYTFRTPKREKCSCFQLPPHSARSP